MTDHEDGEPSLSADEHHCFSRDRLRLPPRTPLAVQSKRSSAIEYDESEGVSDASFASESCTPAKMRTPRGTCTPKHLTPKLSGPRSGVPPRASRVVHEDPVVRTGSALFDESVDTIPQSAGSPDRRLEEICGKLRLRITAVEASEHKYRTECERLHSDLEGQSARIATLTDTCSRQQGVLAEYQSENARLLTKLARPIQISQETSATVPTDSRSADADFQCGRCGDLTHQVERYRHSAAEAEDLGQQLGVVSEERDRLKNELKRLNQTGERVKVVLKENERLKDALKKRFPSNFAHLLEESDSVSVAANDRVQELERKLERTEEQSAREVEALRARHEQIRDDYERTIRSLRNAQLGPAKKLEDGASPQNISGEGEKENQVLRKRVKELEGRVESVKQFYQLKHRRHAPVVSDEGCASSPPVGEREVSLNEWVQVLKDCANRRSRQDIEADLVESDYRKSGLLDTRTFVRALSGAADRTAVQTLVDIYGAGEGTVAYKTFLSDLAVRDGVALCDMEAENRTLRGHVDSLMTELENRIEAAESGQLVETLEHANRELTKKEGELKIYKAELTRALQGNRNMRRVSLGE